MDEYLCPVCGSRIVGEHRDEHNMTQDVWTACGSEWHRTDSDRVRDGSVKMGWTHASAHTCGLIMALQAEKIGAEIDGNQARELLTYTQGELQRVARQKDRARRMLLATGMKEALIDAALEDPADAY